MADALAWPLALGMLGAIMGSFIAALVVRWPHWQTMVRGRSFCDDCKRTLQTRDLVPILSFVVLRGRCRTCGDPIDRRHLVIELLALVIGVVSGLVAPSWVSLGGAAFGWLLLTLGALDFYFGLLPNEPNALLALGGIVIGMAGLDPPVFDRLIGGVAGFGTLWGIGTGYRLLRGREGLGGGDPKLFGAIGLWVGWRMLPEVALAASVIGLMTMSFLNLRGRDVRLDTEVPFGVFLAIAAYPAWVAMVMRAP